MNPALQDSSPAEGRVSDRIPIRRSAICAKRLLSHDNNREAAESVEDAFLRMARVNCKEPACHAYHTVTCGGMQELFVLYWKTGLQKKVRRREQERERNKRDQNGKRKTVSAGVDGKCGWQRQSRSSAGTQQRVWGPSVSQKRRCAQTAGISGKKTESEKSAA